jgi:hypothetical protein
MKNVIKVMAKEIRRVRALAEIFEKYEVPYPMTQLDSMRRMLALLIKSEMLDKS